MYLKFFVVFATFGKHTQTYINKLAYQLGADEITFETREFMFLSEMHILFIYKTLDLGPDF